MVQAGHITEFKDLHDNKYLGQLEARLEHHGIQSVTRRLLPLGCEGSLAINQDFLEQEHH
jgi:hypothetical protein